MYACWPAVGVRFSMHACAFTLQSQPRCPQYGHACMQAPCADMACMPAHSSPPDALCMLQCTWVCSCRRSGKCNPRLHPVGGKACVGIWGRCMSVCIVAPSWCRLNLHSIGYLPCLCTCACITAHTLLQNFASGEEFMSHGLEKRLELGTHVCIWGVRRNVTTNLLC